MFDGNNGIWVLKDDARRRCPSCGDPKKGSVVSIVLYVDDEGEGSYPALFVT